MNLREGFRCVKCHVGLSKQKLNMRLLKWDHLLKKNAIQSGEF